MMNQEEFALKIVNFLKEHAKRPKKKKVVAEKTELDSLYEELVTVKVLSDLKRILTKYKPQTIINADDSFNIRGVWLRNLRVRDSECAAAYVRDKLIRMPSTGCRRRGIL